MDRLKTPHLRRAPGATLVLGLLMLPRPWSMLGIVAAVGLLLLVLRGKPAH